jgi:hypothetical protein
MEILTQIGLGIGLAAACGFRVFLPLALLSLAARAGIVPLATGFGWLASREALVVLVAACLAEIAAYYVPWVDHLLDTLATPAAVAAGVLASAAVLVDLPPAVRWSVALVAGGGAAGLFQGTTVVARHASTLLTLGLGNFLVATAEAMLAVCVVALAILLPFAILFVVLGVALWRLGRRREATA